MSSDTNHGPAGDLPRSIGAPARRALAAAGYTRLLREAHAARGLAFAERER